MQIKKRAQQNSLTGFTLIELLVVIAVIGLLASIVLVSLGPARVKARDARRVSDLKQISLALELYFDSRGAYPVGAAGSDRPCWVNNEGFSACHPLGALKDEGLIAAVPFDPGTNTYTQNKGGCAGAQFYSYTSGGSTYRLASVQEQDGFAGCDVACGTWWVGNTYQFCINQGM